MVVSSGSISHTADPAAAPAFYGAVVGWGTQTWSQGDYTVWVAPGGMIGGVDQLPEQAKAMGAPPHWLGYVGVADLDQTAARVEALGGRAYVAPKDIPGTGRFAVFGDPQGAAFAAFASTNPGEPRPSTDLGELAWTQLVTSDLDGAYAFYSELFGWVKAGEMDMGPGMGTYQMFGRSVQDMVGGMMRHPPGQPRVAWVYYFRVASCDAAFEAAVARGATALYPPMDVPGNDRAALLMDPQGAAFGVVGAKG